MIFQRIFRLFLKPMQAQVEASIVSGIFFACVLALVQMALASTKPAVFSGRLASFSKSI